MISNQEYMAIVLSLMVIAILIVGIINYFVNCKKEIAENITGERSNMERTNTKHFCKNEFCENWGKFS